MLNARPDKAVIERACRLYKRADDAGRALGVGANCFNRWCKEYGVQSIWDRKQARKPKRKTHAMS